MDGFLDYSPRDRLNLNELFQVLFEREPPSEMAPAKGEGKLFFPTKVSQLMKTLRCMNPFVPLSMGDRYS